jgi:hypothetical protein
MKLRFTIRDLLWLTLVVALAVGWWVDHEHDAQRLAELGADVRPLGTYNVSDLVIPVRPSDQ